MYSSPENRAEEENERPAHVAPTVAVGEGERPAHDAESILRALTMLQRTQGEQTRILRQLQHELANLKADQSQQNHTVAKLDRRLRWARYWRLAWLLLRLLILGVIISAILSWFDPTQIRTFWEQITWLLT